MPQSNKSYSQRSHTHHTPLGRQLLQTIHTKHSNLCLSIDLTCPETILSLAGLLGPKICVLKTHIDIIQFPSSSSLSVSEFTANILELSKKHSFLIFEDRKFADIGSTVSHQYTKGIYNISSWAHIVNAHTLPGPGIISGLKSSLSPTQLSERGLLLLYEMSSAGNLFSDLYKEETLRMAKENKDFVLGFISQGAISANRDTKEQVTEYDSDDWIIMTPGVNIDSKGDSLGQQYNTPEHVIGERGTDIIIVGRGIYKSGNPEEMLRAAEEYRRRGWEAYERRVAKI